MLRPTLSSWFGHPKNTGRGEQIMNFIDMLLSVISFYFLSLSPKCIFQCPITEQPEPMFFPECERLRFKLCRSMGPNKWSPVAMEWHVFWLRVDKRPPPRMGAVNVLNKQLRTTDKEWQSTLEVGRGAKNSSLQERNLLLNYSHIPWERGQAHDGCW